MRKSQLINIFYLLGFGAAWQFGVLGYYILLSTLYVIVRHHKQLWRVMNEWGEGYAGWIRGLFEKKQ